MLLFGLRSFERAPVASIKALLTWVAALGGLVLAVLLLLTGRGGIVLVALPLFGPMLWSRLRGELGGSAAKPGPRQTDQGARRPPPTAGGMTRADAYAVLGLAPGASAADIQAAYLRVMRQAHPDGGGSDWLAARVNQARDILMARS